MDWDEFLRYVKRFASNNLCQKLGYLLSLMAKTDYRIPKIVLSYLESRAKAKIRLDQNRSGGTLVAQWQVYDNIGEKKLLTWWLHG